MANHALHPNGKRRGGDRRSAEAKAGQAERSTLVTEISERRAELDQAFFDHPRKLRRMHGDQAVDRALSMWQQQRDAVAIAPRKQQEHGPQHFRK